MTTYLPGIHYGDTREYCCSDHSRWYENGYSANTLNECPQHLEQNYGSNPQYHKSNDTVETIDMAQQMSNRKQISNFAQLAVVYLSEFAKGTLDF